MHEIRRDGRVLADGTEIVTYAREITMANSIVVEAGTNGYMGGDSGHGSRTYLRIEDMGGTDMRARPLGRYADEGFELVLEGDCELTTMITALKFAARVLEEQAEGVDE